MTETADTLWSERPDHQADTLMVALRGAGLGVAVLNTDGGLVAADTRFLVLLGIDDRVAASLPKGENATLQGLLNSEACGLSSADAGRLSAAWTNLLGDPPGEGSQRSTVELHSGRTLELSATRAEHGRAVLTVNDGRPVDKESAKAQSRLVHDMNNLVGGVLANMYLCLADLPSDHPVRERLETVNRAAVDLRELVRQLSNPTR